MDRSDRNRASADDTKTPGKPDFPKQRRPGPDRKLPRDKPEPKQSGEAARSGTRFDSYACSGGCPVEATLERIGGKWKGVALYHMLEGPKRYNQLKRDLGTVTQRMLTKQLRELEADGLIARTVYPVIPPHVDYRLTDKGETLRPILLALKDWGERELKPAERIGSKG